MNPSSSQITVPVVGPGANVQQNINDMLASAQAQGGAVGVAADRLVNPKKSFFATMTQDTLGVLQDAINTLAIPSNVIAGLLDPNSTVADAIQNHETPADALLGPAQDQGNWWSNAGMGVVRFGLSTMLDPMTYLGFGEAKGILGLAKGAEMYAGENLAGHLAETGIRKGIQAGDKVALSQQAEDLAARALQAQRNGLRQTFLNNEKQKMISAAQKAGVDIRDPEQLAKLNSEISTKLAEIDAQTSDSLIAKTLNSNLDMPSAISSVSRMLEAFPHLSSELIDQGGIKYFGKTILAAQRINAIKDAIPGMTQLDNMMTGLRGVIGNVFTNNYVNGARLPDQVIDKMNQTKNNITGVSGEMFRNAEYVQKALNLSPEEWSFVTAAVEHDMKPSDPRISDAYQLMLGEKPDNGTVPTKIWQAVTEINKMNKKTLRTYRDAGLSMRDQINYMPHVVVGEKVTSIPFTTNSLKTTTGASKFAKFSTFVDEKGTRTPVIFSSAPDAKGMVKAKLFDENGNIVEKLFKYNRSQAAQDEILKIANQKKDALQEAFSKLSSEVDVLHAGVKSKVSDIVARNVAKIIGGVKDVSEQEIQEISKAVSSTLDNSTVNKLVTSRLQSVYKAGIKVGDTTYTDPNLVKVVQDLVEKNKSNEEIAAAIKDRVNTAMQGSAPVAEAAAKTARTASDPELVKGIAALRKSAEEARVMAIKDALNPDALKGILSSVVDNLATNPKGMQRLLDGIISKSQDAADVKDQLHDLIRATDIDLANAQANAGKFTDVVSGKVLSRVRSWVEESNSLFKAVSPDAKDPLFETNAMAASLYKSFDAIRVSSSKDFIKWTAERFGRAESKAPVGFVPIDKVGLDYEGQDLAKFLVNSDGERLFFDPTIAKAITQYAGGINDAGTKQVLKAYDTMQNYFKASVTSIWPSFHGRNALSNVFLMFNKIGYHALDPVMNTTAARMINLEHTTRSMEHAILSGTKTQEELSNHLAQIVFTDKHGYKWSWGEMRDALINNVVAFHSNNYGIADQFNTAPNEAMSTINHMFGPASKAGKIWNKTKSFNPLSRENYAYRAGFSIGQKIEDFSRTVAFLAQLKETGDPLQAARTVKLALFDYANLSPFEKNFLRRVVPFYSFTRKNLELQARTLLTSPGRIAMQARAITTLNDVFGGKPLSDKEFALLPPWVQKGYNVVTKRQGSNVTLLNTLGTPLEAVFQGMNPSDQVGMISPLLKTPLELATGYSMYFGKPISQVTNADAYQFAPKFIKDYIGYARVKYTDPKTGVTQYYNTSFMPDRMYVLSNLQPFGRTMSEISKINNAPDSQSLLGSLLFGFTTKTYDLQKEQQYQLYANQKALEDILNQAKIGYTFQKYVPPKPTI
jgi:hypothetical protein